MKHRPLLRILTLAFIVMSCFSLAAVHIKKKRAASLEQAQESNGNMETKKTHNEVMIWESLSRHFLSFN